MVDYPNIQIAVGNDNAAGLSAFETVLASYDTFRTSHPGLAPLTWGQYNPGQYRVRGDGTVFLAGTPSIEWIVGIMTRAQLRGLMDDYCAGGYSGKVTIKDRLDDATTYANYNAVMILPKLTELQTRQFIYWENIVIRMTRLVAL